jgi:hypothetical protein
VKTRLFGIPLLTEALEVVEWDEPRRLRVAHRSFIRGFGEWALADIDGGTRLRWVEDVSMPISGLGELALRAYRPFLRRSMGGSLTALVAAMAAD